MSINPEFRRNLWLEITRYRLVGMPLILLAVFYLTWLSEGNRLAGVTATTSMALFFVISLIWGTRLASESITSEIRDHTWDGQRMSAIPPWSLTWGKLFGSTIYTWYGAAICLFAYWISAPAMDSGTVFKTVLIMALIALLAHSISIMSSLIALQKERKLYKSQTAAFLLIGIMVALPFFNMTYDGKEIVRWYGLSIPKIDFVLLTISLYTAWAVAGIYNLMRIELQMKNTPWPWLCFVLFLMAHVSGFFHTARQSAIGAVSAAFFVSAGATYFTAFTERKDFLSLRNLVRLIEAGRWNSVLLRMPRWLLSLPLTMSAGILVLAFSLMHDTGDTGSIKWLVATCMIFMIRDFSMMIFFNLSKSGKRADIITMLCLALLYGLLPAILTALELKGVTVLFWPHPEVHPLAGLSAALAETALAGYLMFRRWRLRLAEEGT